MPRSITMIFQYDNRDNDRRVSIVWSYTESILYIESFDISLYKLGLL